MHSRVTSVIFSDYESDERGLRCQYWRSGVRHLDGFCGCRGSDDYFHRLLCSQADFGKDHLILRDIF